MTTTTHLFTLKLLFTERADRGFLHRLSVACGHIHRSMSAVVTRAHQF